MPKCTVCHQPQLLEINLGHPVQRPHPFLETGNSELETQLATLRRFLLDLDLTLDDLPPNRKITEKLPKNQREISEKSAKNIPPDTEKYLQYQ